MKAAPFVTEVGRAALAALLALVGAAFLLVGVGPHVAGYRTATVLTDSMAPTYPSGSLLFIRPVPVAEIRVGDVITYAAPTDGHVVTHRVHAVVEPGPQPTIITKGDALAAPDPWTTKIETGPVWRTEAGVAFAGTAVTALRRDVLSRGGLPIAAVLFVVLALAEIWWPRNRRATPSAAHPTVSHAPPLS